MLDELQRRNYSPHTVSSCLYVVESFASNFHCSRISFLSFLRWLFVPSASSVAIVKIVSIRDDKRSAMEHRIEEQL